MAGMVVSEVSANVLQIRSSSGGSSGYALRTQHLLKSSIHFRFFNELAPVGLRDTFPHSGSKASIFLKQAQRGILHQALGIGACVGGNLRKLRFLLGRKMDFHHLQSTAKPFLTQCAQQSHLLP
jgi:hypothetical protein